MDAIIDDESMVTGYVYGLFATDRPMLLWECRYIGKTRQTLRQRLNNHKCAAKKRDVYRDQWIRSVWERGADVVIVPFEQYTASKSEVADTLNIQRLSGLHQGVIRAGISPTPRMAAMVVMGISLAQKQGKDR